MAILGKDLLPEHGPYFDFLRRDEKLVYPKGDWPGPEEYMKDAVFSMADDFLGSLCTFTGKYAPFDLYEITQLSQPGKLTEFADIFLEWAMDIMRRDEAQAMLHFKSLTYYSGRQDVTGQEIKLDVSETLVHIARLALDAAKNKGYLVIVGI